MKPLIIVAGLSLLLSCSKDVAAIEPPPTTPPTPPTNMNTTIRMVVADRDFTVKLNDTPAATAFRAILPLTLSMRDYNNNEKVESLPNSLPTAASTPRTIETGDLMLYGSNSLVLFYETFNNSYSYTRIGRVENTSGIKAALGRGAVTIKFE